MARKQAQPVVKTPAGSVRGATLGGIGAPAGAASMPGAKVGGLAMMREGQGGLASPQRTEVMRNVSGGAKVGGSLGGAAFRGGLSPMARPASATLGRSTAPMARYAAPAIGSSAKQMQGAAGDLTQEQVRKLKRIMR